MDNTFKTVDSVEELLGRKVMAVVFEETRLPDRNWMGKKEKRYLSDLIRSHESSEKLKKRKHSGVLEPLVLLSDPGSPVAESFRSLRGSVLMGQALKDKKGTRILICSAQPLEGKSFIAANLAVALSLQEKKRTLLIDADLRCPTIAGIFNFDNDSVEGLGGALESFAKGDIDYSVISSGLPGLDILPAGKLVGNPAELLSSSALEQLLMVLGEYYDRIVIDSSPVNTVADTLEIAPLVDVSLLVVRASYTPRQAALRACQLLEEAGPDLAGIVLNGMPKRSGGSLNPYFYHYATMTESYHKAYRDSYER